MRQKKSDEFVVLREVGYYRVSTDQQDTELQKQALRDAGCTVFFKDEFTGTTRHRPGLDLMLSQLQPGDRVNVWKVDRLGRNTLGSLELLREFEEKKVAFRSLTQPIDTATTMGKMLLVVLFAFAEFERDTIVERVNAGLAIAREREIVGGTKRALDGDQVARARAMYAERPINPATGKRYTTKQMAALFGVHYSTFLRWAQPDYFDGSSKDAQRFRERHANVHDWLEKSNDPNYSRSPKRLRKVG